MIQGVEEIMYKSVTTSEDRLNRVIVDGIRDRMQT